MNQPTPDCKCTTCRHKHTEASRVYVPKRGQPYIRVSSCPKCGGKNWYRL